MADTQYKRFIHTEIDNHQDLAHPFSLRGALPCLLHAVVSDDAHWRDAMREKATMPNVFLMQFLHHPGNWDECPTLHTYK